MTDPTNTAPIPYQSGSLEPCPFCGGQAMIVETMDGQFFGGCRECGASASSCSGRQRAIDRWNRRTYGGLDALIESVDRLNNRFDEVFR